MVIEGQVSVGASGAGVWWGECDSISKHILQGIMCFKNRECKCSSVINRSKRIMEQARKEM